MGQIVDAALKFLHVPTLHRRPDLSAIPRDQKSQMTFNSDELDISLDDTEGTKNSTLGVIERKVISAQKSRNNLPAT